LEPRYCSLLAGKKAEYVFRLFRTRYIAEEKSTS